MAGIRKFGLEGTTRYRIYMGLAYLLFAGLFVLGEKNWIAMVGFGVLIIWVAFFDSIGPDGERRILGIRPDASFFGKQTRVDEKED